MTQSHIRASHPRRGDRFHLGRVLGWPVLLLVFAAVIAACGNGDGDTEATPAADATTATTAAGGSEDSGNEAPDDTGTEDDTGAEDVPGALEDLASETGGAVVTIGDETFEFSLAGTATVDGTTYVGRCSSIFGMVAGSGFATDGRDITVDIEIPPVDWESFEDDRYDAPAIEVEDNESNGKWVADAGDEFIAGSGVGEFEQDGTSASGSAVFVNQWAPDSDPVEGTFAIDCEG